MGQIIGFTRPWLFPFVLLPFFIDAIDGAFYLAIVCAAIAIPLLVYSVTHTKELKIPEFWRVVALYFIMQKSLGIFRMVGGYLIIYYVFNGALLQGASYIAIVGSLGIGLALLNVPFIAWICNKYEKHNALRFAIVMMMIGTANATIMKATGPIGAVAAGIVVVMCGIVVVMCGFDVDLGPFQKEGVFTTMRLMFSFAPAVLLSFCLLLLYKYPLTRKRMYEIKAILKERRASGKDLGKLVFYVGLPLLLFDKISTSVLKINETWKIFVVILIALIIIILIAGLIARILKVPKKAVGTFVQAAFRGNFAFVGLPVIFYAFGANGDKMSKIAVLAMAPLIPLTTFASLLILISFGDDKSKISFKDIFIRILKNPLFLITLFALPFSIFQIQIPPFILRSTKTLGQTALPLALLSIGASLSIAKIKGNVLLASVAAALNIFLLPLIGYCLAVTFSMNQNELLITMIFLACPAATSSYVTFSGECGNNKHINVSCFFIYSHGFIFNMK